jgi:hypothetical protein
MALKVGVAGPPEEGPAKKVCAAWLLKLPVNVPTPLTGEPLTVKTLPGRESPTLTTVPPFWAGYLKYCEVMIKPV